LLQSGKGREDLPRIAYVNGRYLPLAQAAVNVEDRGYQFADGIYEVAAILNGRMLDWAPHMARLERSARELQMALPMGAAALELVARRLLRLNRVPDALLYIQVTRGVAKRDHAFPANAKPALVMTVRPFDFRSRVRLLETGIGVHLVADERWGRPDIKSVSLLPNVLAKEAAKRARAAEAWMVDRDGHVTEGGSTNAWIVSKDGAVVTRRADGAILAGVMRGTLMRLQNAGGIRIEERPFTPEEAKGAAEAFITSTTNPCVPVTRIDGEAVGDGKPGPVTRRLADAVWAEITRQTGWHA